MAHDTLVAQAVRWIEQNDTCDNGSWLYWIDKSGNWKVDPTAELLAEAVSMAARAVALLLVHSEDTDLCTQDVDNALRTALEESEFEKRLSEAGGHPHLSLNRHNDFLNGVTSALEYIKRFDPGDLIRGDEGWKGMLATDLVADAVGTMFDEAGAFFGKEACGHIEMPHSGDYEEVIRGFNENVGLVDWRLVLGDTERDVKGCPLTAFDIDMFCCRIFPEREKDFLERFEQGRQKAVGQFIDSRKTRFCILPEDGALVRGRLDTPAILPAHEMAAVVVGEHAAFRFPWDHQFEHMIGQTVEARCYGRSVIMRTMENDTAPTP